jgi:hypothetical protein
MEVFLAEEWRKYGDLRAGWLRLLESFPGATPFMDPDLCRLWMEHEPQAVQPAVIAVGEGREQLSTIAPLCLCATSRLGQQIRRLRFMIPVRWLDSDFIPPGPEVGIAEMILEQAFMEWDVDVVELSGIPGYSSTIPRLEQFAQRSGFAFEILRSDQWRTSGINLTGDWKRYLARLSSKTRYNFRRAERKVTSRGRAVIERYRADDDIAGAERCIESIMGGSWKDPDSYRAGGRWREIIDLMHRKGWLDLRLLKMDDVPVAFLVLLRYGDVIYFMQTGYDRGFDELSPGTFILSRVLESCFEERGPARTIDFLTAYPYLRKLADFTRDRVEARLYPPGVRGTLLSKAFRIWRDVGGRDDIATFSRVHRYRQTG